MGTGAITSYIDVAQIVLYAFWIFFAGLIFYLRREDRREGYPLESETPWPRSNPGVIWIPEPKTFRLAHGGMAYAPTGKADNRELKAEKFAPWPGAPLVPTGDPMYAGVGPASYAERSDTPDMTHNGEPRIVPMRADPSYSVAEGDPDPRGMTVIAGDRQPAGTVRDLWVDRGEQLMRYIEIEVAGGEAGKTVLAPLNFAVIDGRRGRVTIDALMSRHFADVPALRNPDEVTMLEEERIVAFFGGGLLYADPKRTESLI